MTSKQGSHRVDSRLTTAISGSSANCTAGREVRAVQWPHRSSGSSSTWRSRQQRRQTASQTDRHHKQSVQYVRCLATQLTPLLPSVCLYSLRSWIFSHHPANAANCRRAVAENSDITKLYGEKSSSNAVLLSARKQQNNSKQCVHEALRTKHSHCQNMTW